MAEMKGFIFAVTFLIVFTGLFAAMPTALYGLGTTATTVKDIDPSYLSDFASKTDAYTRTDFSITGSTYFKYYDLGGYSWSMQYTAAAGFTVLRKLLWIAGLWFGAVEHTEFFLKNGTSRGETVTFAELQSDASDGVVRYDLKFTDNSNDAGGFVFYWNTTANALASDAWTADDLSLIHGMGVSTPNTNVIALLVGLLTFQIPNIPTLPNLIIITPIGVCVLFLFWFIIKESLPFW